MAAEGVLLVWLAPEEGSLPAFRTWHHGGGFVSTIPGVTGYSALSAQDEVEEHTPYRFQIAYFVDDVQAITSNIYDNAMATKPNCVKSADWHLYRSLLIEGVKTMPSGSVCVQVGQTPGDDPGVLQDFDQWFRKEHLPMLTKVPGWRAGRRMEFVNHVGGVQREYAAPFIANHRYLPENGLNGPEWQESVHTEWTAKVRGYMIKPNHRRIWTIEKEVLLE
ncbi:hypothetical protein H2200_007089 [Cladophialophora chaetospira]|uniref:EthD domain-containing protein n=1 Tax=Cladophialophora chaetospira TaxID=386627 RepID=A0AA38X7L4_9EURO|nr:hypothetical protein H2200_007089 [Cladophialophora chaetospira]